MSACWLCDEEWPMDRLIPWQHVVEADGQYGLARCTKLEGQFLHVRPLVFGYWPNHRTEIEFEMVYYEAGKMQARCVHRVPALKFDKAMAPKMQITVLISYLERKMRVPIAEAK